MKDKLLSEEEVEELNYRQKLLSQNISLKENELKKIESSISWIKRNNELRKEYGISQAKLADCIGVSYAVVCYWETDRSEPTAPNIVKLADFFDVTADYLLGRSDY